MGKYTVQGSPAFDALLDSHMEQIADAVYASKFSKHWKAVVLLGGYGRGEGTPLIDRNGNEQPFNDYDLIVVTQTINPLICKELKNLEVELTEQVGLPVDLFPYLESKLPHCEFSLLNYEMKYGHMVIRGDLDILKKMPDYPHDQIPLSEGTRLLMNRGKLLLDVKNRLSHGSPLTKEEHGRFIKFIFKNHLAFGDCALLIRGVYDISYCTKKERIKKIHLDNLPDSRAFIENYQRAIAFKERASFQPLETANLHIWLDETIGYYLAFFLWYERRRLNRKFRTLEKYAHSFPHLGNEGTLLKNVFHNLRTFGAGAIPHPFTHPRLRLYATVPLLLTEQANLDDVRWLLGSSLESGKDLSARFVEVQNKFS